MFYEIKIDPPFKKNQKNGSIELRLYKKYKLGGGLYKQDKYK